MDNLSGLIAYILRVHRSTPLAPAPPWLAIGRVSGSGTVLGPHRLDPEGTWRASHLQLVGPLYLSPANRGYAQQFHRAFKIRVVTSTASDLTNWYLDVQGRVGA